MDGKKFTEAREGASAGVDEKLTHAALPARWPLAIETPIRGWEKALIRQFFFFEELWLAVCQRRVVTCI